MEQKIPDATELATVILDAGKMANPYEDKCDVIYAIVLNVNPIKIRLETGGLEIPASFITMSPFCKDNIKEIPNHTHNVPQHKTQEVTPSSSPPSVNVKILENNQPSDTLTAEVEVSAGQESGHSHDVTSLNTDEAGYYKLTIWEGLKVNDRVLVLRAEGGQRYTILWAV